MGLLLGSALAFGAALGLGVTWVILIGAAKVTVYTQGPEHLKGIRDVKGDRAAGVDTIATVLGEPAAVVAFIVSVAAVGVLSQFSGSALHLWVMLAGVLLPGFTIGVRWLIGPRPDSTGRVIAISAWLWITGLLAIATLGL